MAGPVLLVHDDIAAIAAVRRLLAREGHEVILATNAADALIAFGHFLPSLIVLAPAVEGHRGPVVLEELAQHPDAKLARVLLLGETIPGFGTPVVPLPLDGASFLQTVHEVMRAPSDADTWKLAEHLRSRGEGGEATPLEPDPWRATAPPTVSAAAGAEPARLDESNWELAAMSPQERQDQADFAADDASRAALEQVRRDAEATPVSEAGPAPGPADAADDSAGASAGGEFDDELQRLEAEVRAEAARRRQLRDGHAGPEPTTDPAVAVVAEPPAAAAAEVWPEVEEARRLAREASILETEAARERALVQRRAALDVELDRLRSEAEHQAARELEAGLFGDGAPAEEAAPEASALPSLEAGREQADGDAGIVRLSPGESAVLETQAKALRARESSDPPPAAPPEGELAEAGEAKRAGEEAEADGLSPAEAARMETERLAAEQLDRLAAEEAAYLEAERAAADEAVKTEAERGTEDGSAHGEAEPVLADEATRADAERLAAEESERAEAERVAAEEAVRVESERLAAEELAALEAERLVAEEAARGEAERLAAEEAARAGADRLAAERLAAEESTAERIRLEAERLAAEEIARLETERAATEETERAAAAEAEALRAQDEAERFSALQQEATRARDAAEQAERARAEAEARSQAEISRLEKEKAAAKKRADTLAAEAADHEIEAQRARERAAELASSEQTAKEAATRALAAAEAAQHDAEELAARLQEDYEAAQRRSDEVRRESDSALEASRRQADELLREERARRTRLEAELEATRAAAEKARIEAEQAARTAEQARLEKELEKARAAAEQERLEAEEAARVVERARLERELAKARLAEEKRRAAEGAEQLAQQQRLERELAQARARADESAQLAERERATREAEEKARREAELAVERARDEAKQAAEKAANAALLPLEVPGRTPLGVPRSGATRPEPLAGLVATLCLARAEVRLELKTPEALRTLWLRRGTVVGAISSLPYESLLDRARRDGLIDGRQESELRLLRSAASSELLRVLLSRRYLREAEAVPLVQRHTEQIALEAMSEPESLFRIAEESAPEDVALAASPRPGLQLAAEALRRSLTCESALEALGGLGAVPFSADTDLDLRSLGMADRERRLIGAVDGEATVEDLLLGIGLKQDAGLKALSVAKALGIIGVRPPAAAPPAEPAPEIEVNRLEAKYEAIQEADYFSILGLPRTAGADEVERAFQTLAAEFHPMKFAGHPDGTLQHRAQSVHDLLAEAARALQDDRLRHEYARHLLD